MDLTKKNAWMITKFLLEFYCKRLRKSVEVSIVDTDSHRHADRISDDSRLLTPFRNDNLNLPGYLPLVSCLVVRQ